MPKTKTPTTRVGSAVHVFTERADAVEREYAQASGEVTDEVEVAEHLADLAADEALERLAFFWRWLDTTDDAIASERARLDAAQAGLEARRQWATVQILAVLDTLGVKSRSVGTFKIGSRLGSERVVVASSVDPDMLPDECRRWVPPTEGRFEVDKRAAKTYLKKAADPDDDETMPVEGLELVRGDRSVSVK